MIYAASIIILIYAFFIYFNMKGWKEINDSESIEGLPIGISVVIAIRNESENLKSLIDDFKNQRYAVDKFELILVDDHSSDNSKKILEELKDSLDFKMHVLSLDSEKGKKAAIAKAVEAASYNYIVTTDADCSLGKEWLQSYSLYFSVKNADFLAGPVILKGNNSLFSNLQKFEFSVLSGTTAAFFGLRQPIMCNAANMGFSKKLFNQAKSVSKTDHISSGDDVFLLQEAKKICPQSMYYILNPNVIVESSVKSTLASFLQQRLRWAGKSRYYRDKATIAIAALIGVVNSFLIILLCFLLIENQYSQILLLFFILKIILDLIFVLKIRSFFHQHMPVLYSFLLSLFYPFYSVGIAVASFFISPEWKGRKI